MKEQAGELSNDTARIDALWLGAEALREEMVAFTQQLIQTPSLPGQEQAVAVLVAEEMRRLGYDQVSIDRAGNVLGLLRATGEDGDGEKRSVMLNTHIDHVDVGDPQNWPFPPYSATIKDGEIWGRGSSDLKGSLATHVYAGALLKRLGIPMPNDLYVAGVVQEEVGGIGSSILADDVQVDFAVIGEPSYNKLALGHRGRIEIVVTITGKSVHASVPKSGVNPLYSMSRFLMAVEGLEFESDPDHPDLGPTSVAPTLFTTDQTSKNVVPGQCTVVLDVRNTPMDLPSVVLPRVQALLDASLEEGATGTADIPDLTLTTYTGITRTLRGHGSYGVAPESPLVQQTSAILNAALRRQVPTQIWRFATDAGYFVEKGVQVIGFGPGYEHVIHTVDERISIEMMVEGVVACAALALQLR